MFLATGRSGVFQVPVGENGGPPRTVVPGEERPGGFFFSSRLGSSEKYLVAASPFEAFVWRRLPAPEALSPPVAFSATMDLDVWGDRVALLGATRDEHGAWNGDDIVWLGSLGSEDMRLEPFLPALERGGPKKMGGLFFLELGGIRFLDDGSLLVVPGIEPGAYLFGPDGKLRGTWTTTDLGLASDLPTDETQRESLARDPAARERWVNRRRVLDEILPLPSGPALVLRSVDGGETHWDLAFLAPDGTFHVTPLPVGSPSVRTHLRGDVREGRVALLMVEYDGFDSAPRVPRRLLFLESVAAATETETEPPAAAPEP